MRELRGRLREGSREKEALEAQLRAAERDKEELLRRLQRSEAAAAEAAAEVWRREKQRIGGCIGKRGGGRGCYIWLT